MFFGSTERTAILLNLYIWFTLQVLYYCPGLRGGIKKLYNLTKRKDKPKEETDKSEEVGPTQMTLLFYKVCIGKEWPQ